MYYNMEAEFVSKPLTDHTNIFLLLLLLKWSYQSVRVVWEVPTDCCCGWSGHINVLELCEKFLNNVNINKTKVLLPQTLVTIADFGYPV